MKQSTVLKNSISSLAIGKFDGVHLGHKELFKELDGIGGALVIDFGESNITPNGLKEKLIGYPVFHHDINDIKELDGREFLDKIRLDFPNLNKIIVGYDFMFGKDRFYCADDLKSLFNGQSVVVPEVKIDGISVHSGIIREFIKQGDIEMAKKLLGRPYKIIGKKVKGQGLGKNRLVATINIDHMGFIAPKEGVYATKSYIDGLEYISTTFVGHRVSTDRNFAIETHVIDAEPADGEIIEIDFYKKSRDNKAYTNLDKLKEQIEKDINDARDYFKIVS